MAKETRAAPKTGKEGAGREDRLKAALKANLARRKQQAKARSGQTNEKPSGEGQDNG